ncbi:MAG TPA: hypothetical protein DCX07_07610 [Phycisphaerales bacterium]|nr:hypothetical protein [Phycisphaerales bacterium]
MGKWKTVFVFCAALLGGGLRLIAAAETQPAADPFVKLVDETYDKRLAEARRTPGDLDDLAIVAEMQAAAADDRTTKRLKLALAQKILSVAAPLGTPDAVAAAQKALEMIDGIEPLAPIRRAEVARDLAMGALTYARSQNKTPAEMTALTRDAARAQHACAEVLLAESPDEIDAATSALEGAWRLIASARLEDMKPAHAALQKEVNRNRVRVMQFQGARSRLEAAEKSGKDSAIRTARGALAQLYLEYHGDLVHAATYLEGAEDARGKAILGGVAFLRDPTRLDVKGAPDTIEGLIRLAESLKTPQAQQNVADCAQQMCQAVQAAKPEPVVVARVRLLELQLRKVMGIVEGDKLGKQLLVAYKGLTCKLEVLDGARVRATYDFSAADQIRDWSAETGAWAVGKGVLACKTAAYSYGRAINKLQFRGDRPLKITFSGSAKYLLGAYLVPVGRSYSSSYAWHFCYDRGTVYVYGGESYWSGSAGRIALGEVYKFCIDCDGKGGVEWSINGTVIRKATAEKNPLRRGPVQWILQTESSDRSLTAFDDVVIEGEVVTRPGTGEER